MANKINQWNIRRVKPNYNDLRMNNQNPAITYPKKTFFKDYNRKIKNYK